MLGIVKNLLGIIWRSTPVSGSSTGDEAVSDVDLDLLRLLIRPEENREIEYKSWNLDSSSKAKFAGAAMAIANHGGGHIIFGFKKDPETGHLIPDEDRPNGVDWRKYSSDILNGIIESFADPVFECVVRRVPHPEDGREYVVVILPRDFDTPIRSKKNGPDDENNRPHKIRENFYYVRRPRPAVVAAEGADLNRVLERCIDVRMRRRQRSYGG